ncbi:MAG: glycosyltransferase [Chloroflexi bacterium]|nr:glycosyltransferase [Chloroflexota bacterium]
MKILQICQSYPPMISGAALAAARLAEGLAQEGHEVLVIAASDRRDGYSTQNGRLRIERLPSHHNPMRVGQRILLWPNGRIHQIAAAFNPDIIHLHEPLTLGMCAAKIGRRLNIPTVLTLHQLPWFVTKYTATFWGNPFNFEKMLWQYGRWFLSQCTAVIAPARPVADVIRQRTGRIAHIIPNGADLQHFQAAPRTAHEADRLRRHYGLSPDKPVILYVGRLDADKDVDCVVQAAARVMKHLDAELLLVGDGCRRPALTRQCEALGIASRSHFTGFVSPDGDLPGLYRLANVFVIASDIETFGIVILEAMASALPVVAVRATSIPELVSDRCSGFLVAPKDVDALAKKITWLLQNPIQARKMGQAGREISQQFGHDAVIQRHLQLYQSVCLQRRALFRGVSPIKYRLE